MSPLNETSRYAAYFCGLQLDEIPRDIVHSARWLILDTLGCIAAAQATPPAAPIAQVAELFGGAPGASQAGLAADVGVARAVYANARLANLLDFDETYPVGVHFGVGAVAAAIGAAESGGRSGRDLLTGVIAGYEAGARMASAIGPMMQVSDGVVAGFSRVWGVAAPVVVAACVAYGRTLGAGPAVLARALGIAGSNIPLPIGSKWSDAIDLPDVKYCDAGWCAVAGVHGVHSALLGLTGFEDILEGESGIPQAYSAVMADPRLMLDGLGASWHLADLTYKPWPCCRFMHAPLSALQRLLRQSGISADAIEEVIIHTGPLADSGRFRNPQPRTFASHQFSYPHVVAMMALRVRPGPDWFDPAIAGSAPALALRAKVRIKRLPAADAFAGAMVRNQIRKMPGGVTLKAAGKEWTTICDYADGDPWSEDSRFDRDKVVAKFFDLAGRQRGEPMLAWLDNGEHETTLHDLTAFIREM
ncbi:MmgE/PrpD family protein [Pollutimonas bauzanensis]|uniref:2-methylcitrate dehydratase PrpD n=1 Tax=Pollutimonas bauzanensis TaxID=658167 RepID=A0A1M5XVR4_9BURK|nr:MmgE/PrpD family protein [Pollutimonas bauzanensis]SHI03880.1 2-methylcitrate dehydratase PrpD [Pollutimonas bauzanensis]